MKLLGFDIGGTKCAVISGEEANGEIKITGREELATDLSAAPEEMLERLCRLAQGMPVPERIGVSCGGPLDSRRGLILGPPNLPLWQHVEICRILQDFFSVPVRLQNDANACALAEWKLGAGRGTQNMVFLTCGSGMGAGLILNGQLYTGANDNAGECGHMRLSENGPAGYGKCGSFEGFCSGNGIGKLGRLYAEEAQQRGITPAYTEYTARAIALAAQGGDETALAVFRKSGEMLGRALAILVDILNPECIVIGSVYARSEQLLRDSCVQMITQEALPQSAAVCRIVPAALGNSIGDYAALATALL